ncbi:hypothetical protein [Amycolatopsis sp. EV170708-02-1]|nr:hypothetical protein [Amycolatopsis sp. EV170708-02-1]UMP03564.1 hypothetical protein MJQ72_01365 [Amycolatopsis sp. EV170708-02-1]
MTKTAPLRILLWHVHGSWSRELDWDRLAAVGEAGFVHTGLGTDPNRRTG